MRLVFIIHGQHRQLHLHERVTAVLLRGEMFVIRAALGQHSAVQVIVVGEDLGLDNRGMIGVFEVHGEPIHRIASAEALQTVVVNTCRGYILSPPGIAVALA